ncbi:MAG: Sulfate-binding protein precursor [Syntrophorhabdus sp. PtaB.Bin047]|nr:MAG: Sulfate-binding protein precursor [Syntrophorhabdus sp. PtaB.Bin047]
MFGRPLFRWVLRITIVCVVLAVGLWTIWPWLPSQKDRRPRTIVLYGFSILEPVITKGIFPAFQKRWFEQTGQRVELISSFGGSGTVTNQLIMGVPAEVAILSTELDAQRLQKAGVVHGETWKKLPHKGVMNRTPFIIQVRPGNPKRIHDFSGLTQPGVRVVHMDPLTSGAANWAIVAEYGAAVRQPGSGPDAGRAMLLGIWRNVAVQAGSGRAARTQFDSGFGDALITYEQDAIWSRSRGSSRFEIVYPRSTILSEHTVVVIDERVSERQKELVGAFVDFLWSEEAQRIFVRSGFRSVDERLNSLNPQFGHIRDPFFIDDFGGWRKAKLTIIDDTWKNRVVKELKP